MDAEFFKPEPHPFAGQDWLFQLFFQNAGVQSFFPGFQFVQPLLGGRGQALLIYCRSGRRSKDAAQKLLALGYQSVYDFGGVIDWPYELVKEG